MFWKQFKQLAERCELLCPVAKIVQQEEQQQELRDDDDDRDWYQDLGGEG